MIIGRIPGATRVLGKSQGYLGLPVRDVTLHCSVGGPETPAMETAWEPTPHEIARIVAGAPIILRVLGTGHPPVMLDVGDPPISEDDCPGHVASDYNPKVCKHCGTHIDSLRPPEDDGSAF